MKNDIELVDLDFQVKILKNKLLFLSKEDGILNNRIQELKDEGIDIESKLKDRLVVQNKNIQTIQAKCQLLEEEMSYYVKDYPINTSHEHFHSLASLKAQVDDFAIINTKLLTRILNYKKLNNSI